MAWKSDGVESSIVADTTSLSTVLGIDDSSARRSSAPGDTGVTRQQGIRVDLVLEVTKAAFEAPLEHERL